ncbi:hypothetical protein GQX74_015676 [Glossina fuscipes]|nr:hypothetical protein GQX74_015676 [Glossina fuscipes]
MDVFLNKHLNKLNNLPILQVRLSRPRLSSTKIDVSCPSEPPRYSPLMGGIISLLTLLSWLDGVLVLITVRGMVSSETSEVAPRERPSCNTQKRPSEVLQST